MDVAAVDSVADILGKQLSLSNSAAQRSNADAASNEAANVNRSANVAPSRSDPEGRQSMNEGEDLSSAMACAVTPANTAAMFAAVSPHVSMHIVEENDERTAQLDSGGSGACLFATIALASSALGIGTKEGEMSVVRFKVEHKEPSGDVSKRIIAMQRPFTFEQLETRLRADYGPLHAVSFAQGASNYPMRSQVDLDTAIAKSEQPGDGRFSLPLRVVTVDDMSIPAAGSSGVGGGPQSGGSPRHSSLPATTVALAASLPPFIDGGFVADDEDDEEGHVHGTNESVAALPRKGSNSHSPDAHGLGLGGGRLGSGTRTLSGHFVGTAVVGGSPTSLLGGGVGVASALHSQSDPGNVFRMNAAAEAEARREHGVGSEFAVHRMEEAAAREEHERMESLRSDRRPSAARLSVLGEDVASGNMDTTVRFTFPTPGEHGSSPPKAHTPDAPERPPGRSASAVDSSAVTVRPPAEGVRRSVSEPMAARFEGASGFIAHDSDTDDELLAEFHRSHRGHGVAPQRAVQERPKTPDSPPPGQIHGHTSRSHARRDGRDTRSDPGDGSSAHYARAHTGSSGHSNAYQSWRATHAHRGVHAMPSSVQHVQGLGRSAVHAGLTPVKVSPSSSGVLGGAHGQARSFGQQPIAVAGDMARLGHRMSNPDGEFIPDPAYDGNALGDSHHAKPMYSALI
eukprot:Opistho-2@85896